MALEIPKLLQANTTDIHNVVALRDGRLWVAAGHHGAQRCDESCERLIQGEQAEVLGRDIGDGCQRLGEILLVGRDVLRIQRRDLE